MRFLENLGYEPFHCSSEQEARDRCDDLISSKRWPCYFFKTDTSGEKDFEEFYTDTENLDMNRFQNLGVIMNELSFDSNMLDYFLSTVANLRDKAIWEKEPIVDLFKKMLPEFQHVETGKYLDGRM